MILEMHQLLQHFAASEQIMKVLLGILIETFVAPNACVGGAKMRPLPDGIGTLTQTRLQA